MASYTYHAYTRCWSRAWARATAHMRCLCPLWALWRSARGLARGGASIDQTPRAMHGQRQAGRLRTWQCPRGGEHAAPRLRARPGTARHRRWLQPCAARKTSGESPKPRARPVAVELSPPKGRAVARDGERARVRMSELSSHGGAPSAWLEASLSRGVAASEARPRGQCEPFSSHGRMRHAELIGCATLAVGDRVPRTRWRQLLFMSPARRPTWPADGSELGHD